MQSYCKTMHPLHKGNDEEAKIMYEETENLIKEVKGDENLLTIGVIT